MTKTDALAIVAELGAAFPRPELSEESVNLYVRQLLAVDRQLARHAANRLVRTRRFLPTVAEIFDAVLDEAGVGTITAEQAWGVVRWQVRRIGSYGAFPETTAGGRMLKHAVETIGWQELCGCPADREATMRAQFFRVYDDCRRREREMHLWQPNHLRLLASVTPLPLAAPHEQSASTELQP